MRIARSALVIVPLLVLACDREPVAPDTPTLDTPTPSFSATHGGFELYGADDATFFVSCANDGLGEMVRWQGPWRIAVTTVTSSSGNQLWKAKDYELLPGYQITGLTSGDVWTPVKNDISGSVHLHHNGNYHEPDVFLDYYVNQDGDTLFTNTLGIWNLANGQWRVARIEVVACRLY